MAATPGYSMAPNPHVKPDFPRNALVNDLSDIQLASLSIAIEKCIQLVEQLTAEQRINPQAALIPSPVDPLSNPAQDPEPYPAGLVTDAILEIVAKHLPAFVGRHDIREESFDRVYTTEDLAALFHWVCLGPSINPDTYSLSGLPNHVKLLRHEAIDPKIGVLKRDCLPRPRKDSTGNAKVRANRRQGSVVFVRLSAGSVSAIPQLRLIDKDDRQVPADAVEYDDPLLGPRKNLELMQRDWDKEERRETSGYNLAEIINIARAEIYLHVEPDPKLRKNYEEDKQRRISLDPVEYLPTLRHCRLISGRHIRVYVGD